MIFIKPEITLAHRCRSWAGGLREPLECFSGSLWRSREEHGCRVCPDSAWMSPWALVTAASGASFILGGDPVEGSCLAQDL